MASTPPHYDFELDPVSFITIGAVGPPGERTFFLQAAQGQRVVSLVIEKEQALALAASVERLLAALATRDPERVGSLEPSDANMDLLEPVRPEFRVTQLGIGVDEEHQLIVLVAYEQREDEPGQRAKFAATYEQMLTLARHTMEVASQGRPVCELCGAPMDADGHFCPRRNGHDEVVQE